MNTFAVIFHTFVEDFIKINGFIDGENFFFLAVYCSGNQYAFWISARTGRANLPGIFQV